MSILNTNAIYYPAVWCPREETERIARNKNEDVENIKHFNTVDVNAAFAAELADRQEFIPPLQHGPHPVPQKTQPNKPATRDIQPERFTRVNELVSALREKADVIAADKEMKQSLERIVRRARRTRYVPVLDSDDEFDAADYTQKK